MSDDERTLFSIGQMARLFDVNIRTLRYYDKIGLLRPETVNPQSGYRYYSSAQFEKMNTIKYLRALGVSLEQIGRFFESRDIGLMRGILDEQLAEVERKRAELARIEQKIRTRMGQIDEATRAPLGEIGLVDMPERHVVGLAASFSPDSDLEPLVRDLGRKSKLHDAIFLGKVAVSVSEADLRAGRYRRLSEIFLIVEEADAYEGETTTVPAGGFVRVRFRGTHAGAARWYAGVANYLDERGLQVAGPSIETTLVDAGMTDDESQWVTEILVPCAPRA